MAHIPTRFYAAYCPAVNCKPYYFQLVKTQQTMFIPILDHFNEKVFISFYFPLMIGIFLTFLNDISLSLK